MLRVFLGIIAGLLVMGTSQAIICRFMDTSKLGGGSFIISNDEQLATLYGAFFGSIAGAFIGGIAAGFKLSFPQSVLLSLGLSLIASYIFYSKINEPITHILVQYTIACYLVLGTLTGTLISWLNQTSLTKLFRQPE